MNTIDIDFEACDGCKICYKACLVDVTRWDESAKRPVVAYPEDCVQCNLCELHCPVCVIRSKSITENAPCRSGKTPHADQRKR